jgi:hypothetical protein
VLQHQVAEQLSVNIDHLETLATGRRDGTHEVS